MNNKYMELKFFKSWDNLVEELLNDTIVIILNEIIEETKNGDCRISYYADTNEFCNANMEENGVKIQRLDCETYSVPLSNCSYQVLFDFIDSIVNYAIKNRRRGYTMTPIALYDGCKINGENIEFRMGVGLQEE